MAAGSGEEVDRATIDYFRSLESDRLRQMRNQGLSDQRVALIDAILSERASGTTIPTQQLERDLSEQRSVQDTLDARRQQEELRQRRQEEIQQQPAQQLPSLIQPVQEPQSVVIPGITQPAAQPTSSKDYVFIPGIGNVKTESPQKRYKSPQPTVVSLPEDKSLFNKFVDLFKSAPYNPVSNTAQGTLSLLQEPAKQYEADIYNRDLREIEAGVVTYDPALSLKQPNLRQTRTDIIGARPYTNKELESKLFNTAAVAELQRRGIKDIDKFIDEEINNIKPFVEEYASTRVIESEKKLQDYSNYLQERLDAGEITDDEANNLLEQKKREEESRLNRDVAELYAKAVEQRINPIVDVKTKELQKYIEKRYEVQALAQTVVMAPAYAVTGFATGLLGSGGLIGIGLGAASIPSLVKGTISDIERGNVYGLIGTTVETASFAVGAAKGSKMSSGRGYTQAEIDAALQRSKVVQESVAEGVQGVIAQYELPGTIKRYLRRLEDQGATIRAKQYKLEVGSTVDKKILPDARGNVIEVVTRDGVVLERIGVGDVVVNTPKGKTYQKDIIEKSVGIINDGVAESVTQTVEGRWNKKGFIPTREIKTYEFQQQTRADVIDEYGLINVYESKGSINLLSDKAIPKYRITGERGLFGIGSSRNIVASEKAFAMPNTNQKRVSGLIEKGRLQGKKLFETETGTLELTKKIELRQGEINLGSFKLPDLVVATKETIAKERGVSRPVQKKKITRNYRQLPESPESLISLEKSVLNSPVKIKSVKKTDPSYPKMVGGEGDTSLYQNQGRAGRAAAEIYRQESQGSLSLSSTPQSLVNLAREAANKEALKKSNSLLGLTPDFDMFTSTGKMNVKSIDIPSTSYSLLSPQIIGNTENQKSNQQSKEGMSNLNRSVSAQVEVPSLLNPQVQTPKEQQATRQDQELRARTKAEINPISLGMPSLQIPLPSTNVNLFNYRDNDSRKKQEIVHQKTGFNVYGLVDATKKGKASWVKLNPHPVNEQDALDIGSYATDNSISAQFKVVKTNKKAKELDTGVEGYWGMNMNKYRDYKVKNKIKQPLESQFIEKQNLRLDTQGEVKKITLEKMKSDMNKSFVKPNRIVNDSFNLFGQVLPPPKTNKRKNIKATTLSSSLELL